MPRDQDAADRGAVPVQVLRRRVHDVVDAVAERLLQVGRRDRVVDGDRHAVPVRDLREHREVVAERERVARRLDVHPPDRPVAG